MQEEIKFFQTFFYKGNKIRTVEHDGETWWVATDVCNVLEIANVSQAISGNEKGGNLGLDEDEKGILNQYTPGGPQATLCVNEPGLYHLISKSRTLGAKAFGHWIRHEVLPSIRKTGHYSLSQQEPQELPPQLWQEVSLRMHLLSLSKKELGSELRNLRTILAAMETGYNDKDPHLALSKEALSCELHYLRALLEAVETVYNYNYPQTHDNKSSQEDYGPHPVETLVLPTGKTKPDQQKVLLDYLNKTGPVTVRYIQQSGPRSLRNLSADQLRVMLQALVESGKVKIVPVGKTESYQLV